MWICLSFVVVKVTLGAMQFGLMVGSLTKGPTSWTPSPLSVLGWDWGGRETSCLAHYSLTHFFVTTRVTSTLWDFGPGPISFVVALVFACMLFCISAWLATWFFPLFFALLFLFLHVTVIHSPTILDIIDFALMIGSDFLIVGFPLTPIAGACLITKVSPTTVALLFGSFNVFCCSFSPLSWINTLVFLWIQGREFTVSSVVTISSTSGIDDVKNFVFNLIPWTTEPNDPHNRLS